MGRETVEKLWINLRALGARRLAMLAFVGAAVLGIIAVGTYYLSQPQEEVLYSGLSRDDVGRIGGVLKDAGIDFDVSADGATVMVDTGQTAQARMLLAEKGLPQSADSGYDLFNQIGSFGLTSFMQEVTRTRALEGELARTIQSMDGIKSARVHLVLPDPGSFRSDQTPASASVVIGTESANDTAQGPAVRHLVAAAVPGLKLDNVTVLNTEGTILASGDDKDGGSASKMALVEASVARDIEDKIRRTLTPYLGIGNFQVSVAARLNTDTHTTTEVIYDPSSRVERSVRTVKDSELDQNALTSDGAASVTDNIPDAKAAAAGGKSSNSTNDRREELTNYEVSSRTVETTHDGFDVEQLSIAILVNKDRLAAAAGTGTDAVPVEHQLMDIEQLVSSAAGFSKDRGDVLKVAAVAFVGDNAEAAPAGPGLMTTVLGQLGTFVKAAAIIGMVLLVLFLGLRPTVKAILARPALAGAETLPLLASPASPVAAAAAIPRPDGAPPQILAADDINLIEDVTRKMSRLPQKRLEQIVEFDEAQAAAILRQWLHQEEAA